MGYRSDVPVLPFTLAHGPASTAASAPHPSARSTFDAPAAMAVDTPDGRPGQEGPAFEQGRARLVGGGGAPITSAADRRADLLNENARGDLDCEDDER